MPTSAGLETLRAFSGATVDLGGNYRPLLRCGIYVIDQAPAAAQGDNGSC